MAVTVALEQESTRPAFEAYEALAPFYDAFTASYDYEAWLTVLEALALEHGLHGRRLLDVACGTGKSFEPLLQRGYDVTACDLSPRMVVEARRRLGDPARAFVADMRALPPCGPFDLVTCLDDAVNYLLSAEDLEAAFSSAVRVLGPRGLLVFDANTLGAYRRGFARDFEVRSGAELFRWFGSQTAPVEAGGLCAARIDILSLAAPDRPIATSWHVQRHHTMAQVREALGRVGMRLVGVRGQVPGAQLVLKPDETAHSKIVYLARRRNGPRLAEEGR